MRLVALVTVVLASACSHASDEPAKTDADFRAEVTASLVSALGHDLKSTASAAQDLCSYAPTPQRRGWDAKVDAEAIASMKAALARARDAYERVEGAVAPHFPELDRTIDSRYEKLLAGGDAYAFDDQGVVGLDALERILYADAIPQAAVAYEAALPGYRAAAFPANETESRDFREKLCTKLVIDALTMLGRWTSANVDVDRAWGGITTLVEEQRDEIANGASGAEESRYAQRTMDDLRANVEGVEAIYGIFRPWLATKSGGQDVDANIVAGIANVESLYDGVSGDALPAAATADYAQLDDAVSVAVEPSSPGSLTAQMTRAATLLGLTTSTR